jgi:hypothetical protein
MVLTSAVRMSSSTMAMTAAVQVGQRGTCGWRSIRVAGRKGDPKLSFAVVAG